MHIHPVAPQATSFQQPGPAFTYYRMTIPASVFQPGKDRHDTRQVWPSLQSLVRRLCLVSQPTFESLQTLLWQWWMSLPKRPRDFNTLRKHLQSDRPLLNISKRLLRELLAALPGFRLPWKNIANHPLLSRFLVPSFGSVSSSLTFSCNNSILSQGKR